MGGKKGSLLPPPKRWQTEIIDLHWWLCVCVGVCVQTVVTHTQAQVKLYSHTYRDSHAQLHRQDTWKQTQAPKSQLESVLKTFRWRLARSSSQVKNELGAAQDVLRSGFWILGRQYLLSSSQNLSDNETPGPSIFSSALWRHEPFNKIHNWPELAQNSRAWKIRSSTHQLYELQAN